uniref:hypothetical protein Ycf36 n=1 Tax=Aphanocladia delicatula TaxID=3041656 RepID=UPI002551E978|nr:hypothetical protein Ycf36 [Aphanocladia delicatula]WGH14189.1 hypothetical protein Ycf36 [Aphanocladia delicatula]
MFTNKSKCPVPFDQQPLNEYLSLKESLLFSWSMSTNKSFIVGSLFSFIFLSVFFSVFLIVFTDISSFRDFCLLNIIFSNIVMFFLFFRLYLGWSYIVKRLMSAIVFYEESGWYDGQVWIKTSDYLIQDRLIGSYQVIPFIIRLKYSYIVAFFCFITIYLLTSIF